MSKLTVEQRIYRLDKRIAIFEKYLDIQYEALCVMCPITRGFKKTMESSCKIVSIMMQVKIMVGQTIPGRNSFAKGSMIETNRK